MDWATANATRAERRGKFVKRDEDEDEEGEGGGGEDVAGELCIIIITPSFISIPTTRLPSPLLPSS